MSGRFNQIFRTALLSSRWGMAPFCLGLIAALLLVMAQFFREIAHAIAGFPAMSDSDVILAVLRLVDLVFLRNLVVMFFAAGYEIFLPNPAHLCEEGGGTLHIVAIG